MTKQELEAIVRELYGIYNRDLTPYDAPHILRGWWTLLEPYDADQLRNTIHQIILTEDRYLPTAATIKKQHQKNLTKNPPPSNQQFWNLIKTLQQNLHSGTTKNPDQKTLQHPVVQKTLQELQQIIYTSTTNGDRDFILETYTHNTTQYLAHPWAYDQQQQQKKDPT